MSALLILVVDDNDVNRKVTRDMVSPAGRVVEAEDGDEALALIASARPDIVVLDLHMPGRDGFEVARTVRASTEPWSNTAIVGLSADAMGNVHARSLAAGMDAFLTKPVRLRELLQTLGTVLTTRHARVA